MIWLLSILACTEETNTTPTATPPLEQEEELNVVLEYLEPTRLLRRISLDIRAKLPSIEDYQALQSEEKTLEELTEFYLEAADFEESLVHHMGEIWLTRIDEFDIVPDDFNLSSQEFWVPFARSVGEEPLRLMAHIASTDQPWTKIVTAEHSMANELLGSIFPMIYPEDGEGWQPSPYTDGRPAVGVLATNGLWWRYPTNYFNKNRTRAAAITKLLLCDDFLERPITFEASANALEDTELALKEDPACIACHSSLDPLAASMFGFWWVEQFNPLEAVYYHPERELMAERMMGVSPAWFGTPVNSFAMVGELIAQDSRFHQCTVRQFQEILFDREWNLNDYQQSVEWTTSFVEGGFQIKSLIAQIIASPEYRLEKPNVKYPETKTLRMLSPYQMEYSVEALTQWKWGYTEVPLMDYAYRAMAGGVDGSQTFSPQLYPNLSSSMVFKRFSQAQATYLTSQTLSNPDHLLSLISFDSRPEDPEFIEQLQRLRLQLHGYEADEEWLTQTTELWLLLEESGDAESAWTALLSALIQDIDFVSY